MFRWLFIALFCLAPAFTSQAQYKWLFHKTYAQRYVAFDTIFYTGKFLIRDSSVVFKDLAKLEADALAANDEELALEARMLKAEYYIFGKQVNRSRFVQESEKLKQLADIKGIRYLQIRIRQNLGHYYFYIDHKYGPGFDNYLSSYLFLKDITVDELPSKQEMLANIGSAYYHFGDYDNAHKFLAEARTVPSSYKKRLPINLTNTIGLIYRKEGKYDSADFYLWKAYRMAEKLNDSTWMGITAGNIGISYFHQKKYDEAIPLLELDVKQSIKAIEMDNAVNSFIYLAKINFEKGQYLKSRQQANQIRQLLKRSANKFLHLSQLYPLLTKLHALKGDTTKAFLYSDSAQVVKDSLFTRNNTMQALTAERKIELEKHKALVERQEAQQKLQRTIRNSLVGGIFLLIVIGALAINRQRLLHRQKQQKLEEEKIRIQSQLEQATRQLMDFTNNIREKNKLIEQISVDIACESGSYEDFETVITKDAHHKLLKATILTKEQWIEFQKLFDNVYVGYLDRLGKKYPNLSPADTRYIVLSKLNLTPKEMAAMLGVRLDAIRLYRHRLRKKLNIDNNQELEDLFDKI